MTKFIFRYCIHRLISEAAGINHPAKDKVTALLTNLLNNDPIVVKRAANNLGKLGLERIFYMIPCAMGLMYYLGVGCIEQNLTKAFTFFSIGNNFFHPQAKIHLAACYAFGLGTRKNIEMALALYNELLLLNNDFAQFELGFLYEHGLFIKQNKKMALDLYHQAAKLNNPFAQYQLWKLYVYKIYGKQNKSMLNKALSFLARAAEQDHPDAQMDLFRYCFNNTLSYRYVLLIYVVGLHECSVENEADRQCIKANERRFKHEGNGDDYYVHALFRDQGYILNHNPDKALLFYAKAAAKNNPIAEAKMKAWENRPLSESDQRKIEYLKYYT